MASESTKKRPRADRPVQKSKRQKVDPAKNGAKKPVALDALPWNEVKLPDMFDDAEGFFGLEEVEGVEVVKEGDTVKFVCVVPFKYALFVAYSFLGICQYTNPGR